MSGVREGAQVANKSDGRIGAREGMATTVFTVESLGLKSTYMGPTKKKGKGKQGYLQARGDHRPRGRGDVRRGAQGTGRSKGAVLRSTGFRRDAMRGL